jgi:hypothetical protein
MHQVDTIETHVKLGLYLLGNAALSTNSATRSPALGDYSGPIRNNRIAVASASANRVVNFGISRQFNDV